MFIRWLCAIGVFWGGLVAEMRADEIDDVLKLARQTLALVEQAVPRPALAAELAALEKQIAVERAAGGFNKQTFYEKARNLRRRIILSHPALDFERLLINKRTGNLPEHMCDQYLGRHSRPGPGLVILESWKDNPREVPLLEDKLPPGGVIHPDLSWDAQRVLFAFCPATSPLGNEHRGYFIYELSLETGEVRQVTGTEQDPRTGLKGRQTVLIEDFDPCYLPDGGIAFISTRSQQYGRCHGSRYVPSYTLYRCEADGSNIRPLSFNEANEWGPSVLNDGSLVYTRWDYINRHDTIFQSLWIMRPDGTGTAHFYGNYSPSPCLIGEARAIPGSHKVVATAAAHHGQTLGTIIVIDPQRGQDGGVPVTWITPELSFPESGIPRGITLTPKPLEPPSWAASEQRRQGRARAATPYPLTEDLFLVTYQHGQHHAIYLIDTLGGRELIHADPKISCFDPIPLRPTAKPPVMVSRIAGKEHEKTGVFVVQDVYQSTQPLERGAIKLIRVNEIISQPTRSKPILSHVNNEIIKRILGTAEVAADGSVAFEAPACVPLQLQLLDEHGMAVLTMRSLIYAQPGEQVTCVGCHEQRNFSPPLAPMPRLRVQKLVPPAGPRYEGGFSFLRTVQPVLDRYCIGCHGLEKTEGNINLLGTMTGGRFSASYDSLLRGKAGLVKIAQRNGETHFSTPKEYYAHAGRLAKLLLAGHPDAEGRKRVELDRESFQRVVDWLDLNAQFYGDYSFNRIENQPPSAEGEKSLREAIARRFGSELAQQPFAALVNVAMPSESRILKAPLAREAGGWGLISRGGWRNTADPDYREMVKLVEASITPLSHQDIAGTCGRSQGCRCGCCWVRLANEARQKTQHTASTTASAGGE